VKIATRGLLSTQAPLAYVSAERICAKEKRGALDAPRSLLN
jgi:hypothetical protein